MSICLQDLFIFFFFLKISCTFAFLPAQVVRSQFSPQRRMHKVLCFSFETLRKTGEEVPVRVTEVVVTVEVGKTTVRPVTQITERKPQPRYSLCIRIVYKLQIGDAPLLTAMQSIHPCSHSEKDGRGSASTCARGRCCR